MSKTIDALALAQALIRRPSVTPKDAGALDVLEAVLKELGFITHRLPFTDFQQGFDLMRSGKSGKIVLDWSS